MEEKADHVFAVVRLRGSATTEKDVEDANIKLKLAKVYNCTVIPADGTYKGMLHKAEQRITWGEVSEAVLSRLLEKRGRNEDGSRIDPKKAKSLADKILKEKTLKGLGIKTVFKLSPPSGGLKSIRLHYPVGDLGYRGEKINKLLERMI